MSACLRSIAVIAVLITGAQLRGEEPKFRTSSGDQKLPWYEPKPTIFPPADSWQEIAGELFEVDALNRTGLIRPDRTDAIRRGDWDMPLPFRLLPYASIHYHGAPAELRDIPLGTHLHGRLFWSSSAGRDAKGAFYHVLAWEDDFSRSRRLGRYWRIDAINQEKKTLTVSGVDREGKSDPKPTEFEFGSFTRIWKGRAIGELSDLAAGQVIAINLTVCTLKGPGRCVEIWLDEESRELARKHRLEGHKRFMREHGLPALVLDVDHKANVLRAAFFDVFDDSLREDFKPGDGLACAVGEENLHTYDQVNDTMRGKLIDLKTESAAAGDSGLRVLFLPNLMLEGFRPGRFVRIFSAKWKVDDLPREERLYE